MERVNSTVHGTTNQIPLERFKEENLSPLGQVPPYKIVHIKDGVFVTLHTPDVIN
ncbi:Mobile element protein [Methanosarcina sp. WH1]|nr:Mobile element protein [Methanosarcina sp. WH1]